MVKQIIKMEREPITSPASNNTVNELDTRSTTLLLSERNEHGERRSSSRTLKDVKKEERTREREREREREIQREREKEREREQREREREKEREQRERERERELRELREREREREREHRSHNDEIDLAGGGGGGGVGGAIGNSITGGSTMISTRSKRDKRRGEERYRLESPTLEHIEVLEGKHEHHEYERERDRERERERARDLSSVSNESNGSSMHRRSQDIIEYDKG